MHILLCIACLFNFVVINQLLSQENLAHYFASGVSGFIFGAAIAITLNNRKENK